MNLSKRQVIVYCNCQLANLQCYLLKLFMTIVNEQQREQQSSPAFRTLEQKIDEFASGIGGIQDII